MAYFRAYKKASGSTITNPPLKSIGKVNINSSEYYINTVYDVSEFDTLTISASTISQGPILYVRDENNTLLYSHTDWSALSTPININVTSASEVTLQMNLSVSSSTSGTLTISAS